TTVPMPGALHGARSPRNTAHPCSVNQRTLVGSVPMSVSDRAPVAAVVGVGAGLGAALARRFAQEYRVALVARSDDFTRTLADEIRSAGGVALAVQSDATIPAQVSAAYERIRRELGAPEALLYNGGRRPLGPPPESTPPGFLATWRRPAPGAVPSAREPRPAT